MVESIKTLGRTLPRYLTDEEVEDVRRRVRVGESQADVARRYGVHRSTISRIVRAIRRVDPMNGAVA
jgi:transposase